MSTRRLLLILASILVAALAGLRAQERPLVRFGVVTDIHYADIVSPDDRAYRESDAKLAECARVMNEERAAFLVELGDFKDQDTPPQEARTLGFLRKIEAVMAGFQGPRYHVIGNHDVDSLSKAQFLQETVNSGIAPPSTHYTFTSGGVRLVVLDADHKADGADFDRGNFAWTDTNIDPPQVAWLAKTLADSAEPVIVLVHQQLDGTGPYYVKNAADVRQAIEASGKVIAVFQGHRHEGAYTVINGIPYLTFQALVVGSGLANNAFAIVEVLPDLGVRVKGYHRAESREFRAATADGLLQRRRQHHVS